MSAAKFSAGRDFTAHKLWNWAARIKQAAQTSGATGENIQQPARVRLARVVRVSSPAADEKSAGGELSVEFWGIRVVVPTGFDRGALTAVLDGIERRGGTGARKQ